MSQMIPNAHKGNHCNLNPGFTDPGRARKVFGIEAIQIEPSLAINDSIWRGVVSKDERKQTMKIAAIL
jgi:hypothetical protein